MKANRPDLYRTLKVRGELAAAAEEVEERASKRLLDEADRREQNLNRMHSDRKGFLNRVQAMTEAEGVVMREIVLVPTPDEETTTGSPLPG